MALWQRVRERADASGQARIAIFGAGFVGGGLVHRLRRTPGLCPVLIVNRSPRRAVEAWVAAGADSGEVLTSDDPTVLRQALEDGRPAVSTDIRALAGDGIDVVVEATGSLDQGAQAMLGALEAGTSVLSINAEVDATIGYLLHAVARANSATYTICDGDQPGGMLRTHDWVTSMGFDPVVVANCKRHLDRRQDPTSSAAYAARDGTSPAVTTSAGDGTKMQIECAVVANVLGFPPDRRGMHGVPTTLEQAVGDVLAVLSRRGVVEYTLGGDFGAGVFVIGHAADHDVVARSLRFYKMGRGPDYLFFRPHTLVEFEMPVTIAEVWLDGHGLGAPARPPVAEVVAVAKRDLEIGALVDGIGGYAVYGEIDSVAGATGLLPIGCADGARIVRRVAADEPIPLDAVELDPELPMLALRARQDELIAAASASR